jgi:hypothetical protein
MLQRPFGYWVAQQYIFFASHCRSFAALHLQSRIIWGGSD